MKNMAKKLREQDLQTVIKEYLQIKKYLVVKYPSIGTWVQARQQYIPIGKRGVSDLLVCSPTGQFIAIEVKIKPNKPSDEQLEFIKEVKKRKGIGLVVYSLDDVIHGLLEYSIK